MTIPVMDDAQIKNIFKEAIKEVIQEQKEFFSDLFADVLEDIAFIKAIDEGLDTETASREEVFQILEGTI